MIHQIHVHNCWFALLYKQTMSCLSRSKRQTTDVPRGRPQPAFTSSGSVGLPPPQPRCSLTSRSTTSQSWKTTRWLRLWVWCPCSKAPPPCGLTSQVSSPCRRAPPSNQRKASVVWCELGLPGLGACVGSVCWG